MNDVTNQRLADAQHQRNQVLAVLRSVADALHPQLPGGGVHSASGERSGGGDVAAAQAPSPASAPHGRPHVSPAFTGDDRSAMAQYRTARAETEALAEEIFAPIIAGRDKELAFFEPTMLLRLTSEEAD